MIKQLIISLFVMEVYLVFSFCEASDITSHSYMLNVQLALWIRLPTYSLNFTLDCRVCVSLSQLCLQLRPGLKTVICVVFISLCILRSGKGWVCAAIVMVSEV